MAIKGALLDIAGVLYDGGTVIPGAVQAVEALRRAGIGVRFVTNTSRQPKRQLLAHLQGLGFTVAPAEVYTAPTAVHDHLAHHRLRPFLLIHPDLDEDFADLGQQDPTAVVVGDAADRMTYANLNAAFRLLLDGAPLLAIASNRYFNEADGLSLDAGPFVTALEYAAQTKATLFGKPAPAFFTAAVDDLATDPAETLMIGDDVEADVNGARAVGLGAILVQTGKYRAGDEARLTDGARCVADIGAAVALALAGG